MVGYSLARQPPPRPSGKYAELQRLVAGKLLKQKTAFHFTVEDGRIVENDVAADPEHIRQHHSRPPASPKRYAPPETFSNGAPGADLRTRFVHNIERRFRCAAETAESGGRHHVTNTALSGLRAQAQSNFLGP